MPLTTEDIANAVKIWFSHKHIKLFNNEPQKKKTQKAWIAITGYPKGSPDLMGWCTIDGVTHGVELKTIKDTHKAHQKRFLDLMVLDNCAAFLAKETNDGNIELTNWKTKEKELIYVDV